MPITPQFNIGRKQRNFIASKQFTDREFPREVFSKHVDEISANPVTNSQDYHVIVYYGVGGIGKSSLQNQLKKELLDHNENALYTYIDFVDSSFHSPARALLELVKNIKYKSKISFPHFDIVYSIYFNKKNPDYVFNEKKLPFLSEASIIGDILGTLDGFGIAGAVTGIVDKTYDAFKKVGLSKDVKGSLTELEELSAKDIEERLPAFFAYDLNVAIEKNKIPIGVIFLDTYEALWVESRNEATKYSTDNWIRELVSQLPGILFVICGREFVDWKKCDAEWKKYLDQHLLEKLGDRDAESFLVQCGIEEKDIRDKIITASSGHPYHLDLSVDTYVEIKNRGEVPTVDKFGSDKREILDRFLKNLEDEEIETLKLIAIPMFYNEEIFKFLLNQINTGYPITKINDFNKFSFVNNENNERFYIHALMREGLLHYIDKSLLKNVHQLMALYYDSKLDQREVIYIHDEFNEYLSENIYHYKNYLEKSHFISWIIEKRMTMLKGLQLRGETRFLKDLLNDIYKYVGISSIGIELFNILVDMIHLSGEYKNAVTMIDTYLQSYSLDEIVKSVGLTQLYIRRIHHKMFYSEVNSLIRQSMDLEKIIDIVKFKAQYNEILFMIGGNLGVLSGDFELSRKWLYKSIKFAKINKLPDYMCRSLRKYADVLRIRNHNTIAEKFCDIGIKIAKDNSFNRYELYLLCTKADILRIESKYDQALDIFNQTLIESQKLGIKGWEAHINLAVAEVYIDLNRVSDAEAYLSNAEVIYNKIGFQWGMVTVSINRVRCNMLRGLEIPKDTIDILIDKANGLGYVKEYNTLKLLENGKITKNVLLFL